MLKWNAIILLTQLCNIHIQCKSLNKKYAFQLICAKDQYNEQLNSCLFTDTLHNIDSGQWLLIEMVAMVWQVFTCEMVTMLILAYS